ncbi:MAG: hypothetical protein Q7T33_14740 [Dehalococcoidia bacterium]|nr:hypothetical protein [Dehalococcoidia bacterium]
MYAAVNPHRLSHLVLWSPTTRAFDARSAQREVFRELLRRDWHLFTQTTAHASVAGWGASEQAGRFAELMREAIDQANTLKLMDAWANLDVTEYVARIECPVLLLQRRELMFPDLEETKSIAARAKNAQLVLLEGGAHLPWVGDMEAVVRASDEFLGLPAGVEERIRPSAPPPSAGLVTILFTDIEGSTTLTQRLGDARAQEVLRAHNRIVRAGPPRARRRGDQAHRRWDNGFLSAGVQGHRLRHRHPAARARLLR